MMPARVRQPYPITSIIRRYADEPHEG